MTFLKVPGPFCTKSGPSHYLTQVRNVKTLNNQSAAGHASDLRSTFMLNILVTMVLTCMPVFLQSADDEKPGRLLPSQHTLPPMLQVALSSQQGADDTDDFSEVQTFSSSEQAYYEENVAAEHESSSSRFVGGSLPDSSQVGVGAADVRALLGVNQ